MITVTDQAPAPVTPAGTGVGQGHGGSVPLGRWLGVPVRAHWSVGVAVVLFVVVIAQRDLPAERPGSSQLAYWTTGVAVAAVFFVTLLLHELAHAVAARRFGVGVRRITLWMLGGVSELTTPAPTARADAVIAGAGPLASLACGIAFAAAAPQVGTDSLLGAALVWLATINVVLAIFNLLPGAPLDGGRLLRAALWARGHDRDVAGDRASHAGRVLGLTLVGLGLLELVLGALGGVWMSLLGWFIVTSADAERGAVWADRLRGRPVRDAMSPVPTVAPDWWTVDRFLASLTPQAARKPVYPVVDVDGRFRGVVTLADLERVPRGRRASSTLAQLARSGPRLPQIGSADDLSRLAGPLAVPDRMVIVKDGDRMLGVVTSADVARLATTTPTRR